MNIKIGAKIRNLRIQSNITQEKLANHLGVSVQAVSRWESEICYPDLELIPAIAKYFSVTTDHILCTEQETIQPIEEKFKEEWKSAYNSGHTQKALDIINDALLTMPNNYEFLLMKAKTLFCFYEHSCNMSRISESDRLLRSILELLNLITSECKNESIRCQARYLRISLDTKLNNANSVIQCAKRLPLSKYTRNAALSQNYIWQDDIRALYCRVYILELLNEFTDTALILSKLNTVKESEQETILNGIIEIIKVIVDNDHYGEFEEKIDDIYEVLYRITGEDKYKNEIGIHKKKYDAIKDQHVYSSVFLKDLSFKKENISLPFFEKK